MSTIIFESTAIARVPPQTTAQRTSKYRKAHPAKIYASVQKWRHDNSKWTTDTHYLAVPFVAWDGEGITDPDGSHRYVMLAVKSDTDSDYLGDAKGLGSAKCFDFIMAAAKRNPGAIHVIYGGGYDFNMMLGDVPKHVVKRLVDTGWAKWGQYRLGWRSGKSFYIGLIGPDGAKVKGSGVTVYDVVSFFQTSFVKACDLYLGDRFEHRDMIVENKTLRSGFTDADIPEVRKYNDAELQNLLLLVRELRQRLNKVGLRPRRWDGPGAVAAALLMRERVKLAMGRVPPDVAQAGRYAYAGGRFEVIRFGHVDGRAYEYDINSAYPAAMTNLPDLSTGHWEHVKGDPGDQPFAVYHVEYHNDILSPPGAFFRRQVHGEICYPLDVIGWYWSPEVATGRRYCQVADKASMTVSEAWVFHPGNENRPFNFVEGLFNKRRALKKAGDGAHMAIKLGINSLYGKTAQQVGWRVDGKGALHTPPFHQLEWAGYTTSWCRAKVLDAVLDNLDKVIAFETDAVFTTEPLGVTVGSGLGEWELTEFSSLTYVSSGVYFGTTVDGDDVTADVTKTRGVDRGNLTRAQTLERMAMRKADDRVTVSTLTRFVGARLALAQSWRRWRRWETVEKHIRLEPNGKREHHPTCMQSDFHRSVEQPIGFGHWHWTYCPSLGDCHSVEFPVEWLNPNGDMTELDELRRGDKDYE